MGGWERMHIYNTYICIYVYMYTIKNWDGKSKIFLKFTKPGKSEAICGLIVFMCVSTNQGIHEMVSF